MSSRDETDSHDLTLDEALGESAQTLSHEELSAKATELEEKHRELSDRLNSDVGGTAPDPGNDSRP